MTRRRTVLYLVLANVVGLALTAVTIELAGQVFLLLRGSYDVVSLQPDRAVGWTQVPGLRFVWGGTAWYAREFRVPVVANTLGFRDHERTPAKPAGTIRVALLGDSLVEALQVPLEQTAGQLLERRLNADRTGPRYEVLNFGISNYGIGQYLLVWETYARRFAPDDVAVFVAGVHLTRTVQRYETGGFQETADRALWVRPTFRLEGGQLVREPAADFDEFVRVQDRLVQTDFGGRRTRRRAATVLGHFAHVLWARYVTHAPVGPVWRLPLAGALPGPEATLAINLAVLRELGLQVMSTGARLVVVDVARYFDPTADPLTAALAGLCNEQGYGYVALAEILRQSKQAGRPPSWVHDGHFNATGNALFADALYEWLAAHPHRSDPPA